MSGDRRGSCVAGARRRTALPLPSARGPHRFSQPAPRASPRRKHAAEAAARAVRSRRGSCTIRECCALSVGLVDWRGCINPSSRIARCLPSGVCFPRGSGLSISVPVRRRASDIGVDEDRTARAFPRGVPVRLWARFGRAVSACPEEDGPLGPGGRQGSSGGVGRFRGLRQVGRLFR